MKKYGDFDLKSYHPGEAGSGGYYIYTDNKGFLPDHLKHYYYIEYDESGKAVKVYEACQPGG